MLLIKPGCKLFPAYAMAIAAVAIERVYTTLGAECVITSGIDGQHMPTSLHYSGKALDFRTSNILPERHGELVRRVKAALGPEFDVVLEADHLHVEFDPK